MYKMSVREKERERDPKGTLRVPDPKFPSHECVGLFDEFIENLLKLGLGSIYQHYDPQERSKLASEAFSREQALLKDLEQEIRTLDRMKGEWRKLPVISWRHRYAFNGVCHMIEQIMDRLRKLAYLRAQYQFSPEEIKQNARKSPFNVYTDALTRSIYLEMIYYDVVSQARFLHRRQNPELCKGRERPQNGDQQEWFVGPNPQKYWRERQFRQFGPHMRIDEALPLDKLCQVKL